MARRKIKKQVGIGACSEHYRPQKYETRDPFPHLNFDEPVPQLSMAEIVYITCCAIAIAAGVFAILRRIFA